jgi:hypothetical protein
MRQGFSLRRVCFGSARSTPGRAGAPTTEKRRIATNASGTYDVGSYRVHVATSGNTKIREIRIVE